MPRLYFILIINLFLNCSMALGDSVAVFKGKVVVKNDTIAVAYAHIGVLHNGIGTVSNINGEFELKGSFNIDKDSLVISHIEYEKRIIALKDLLQEVNKIELKKHDYELGEVVIFPDEKVMEIFKNVIKNLKVNYPTKLYQCEAFYREAVYEERTRVYTRLLEAALNIQDRKITSSTSNIKCSVLQLRKSNNGDDSHWWNRFIRKILPVPNVLFHLLRDNPARIYKENSRKSMSYYNPLRSVMKSKNMRTRLTGVIKNEKEGDIYHFCRGEGTQRVTNFYINSKNYAIVQCDIESKGVLKKEYRFVRIGEKYYPAFFQIQTIKSLLRKSKGLSRSEVTLTFVNYSPDKRKFKRLKSKHVLSKTLDLYNHEAVYDEDFWNNYNTLLENPIKKKIVTDLSKKESLQTQFEENGKD